MTSSDCKLEKGADKMFDKDREIHELLIDYAGALRDGCIPDFLKSLTHTEGRTMASSHDFWDATETVRILNSIGFADKAAIADVGLFASRVDANIVSRSKKAISSYRGKRRTQAKSDTKTSKTEKFS
jgi:hypothetical protein